MCTAFVKRSSSRSSTVEAGLALKVKQELEEEIRSHQVKRVKKVRPVLTQEQKLQEATQTEVSNRESLRVFLAMEADLKKSRGVAVPLYVGPTIVYRADKDNGVRVSFNNFTNNSGYVQGDCFDAQAGRTYAAPTQPKTLVNPATKQPYRYWDEHTGKPFDSLADFKQLRAGGSAKKKR